MNRIILITILAFFPKFVFAEHITPAQLLERYKATRNALQSYIVKGEDLQESRDTASGDEYKFLILSTFEFRKDVERIDLITNEYFNLQNPKDKSSAEYSSTTRKIWDGETWSNCSYKIAPRVSRASMSKREKKKRDLLALGYEGSSLDGIFAGDLQPIYLILRQASDIAVRPEMEKVRGTNCYVIDATTPNGKYNLWIDPEHGYNISKAKVHKTGSDILYGKPISQHKPPRVREGFRYDGILPGKRNEFFFWLDIIEFKKIGSVWVPVESIGQMESRYVDGRIMSGKHHHKRTQIDLNPDFEAIGAFVPDFPEGTRVYLEDDPGIRYIWHNGKLVPHVDQSFLDVLDDEIEQIKSEVERKPMPDLKEIVRRYSESTSWDKKITMSLSVETYFTSNISGQENVGHHRLELIFRRDNNRAEWIGNDALLDSAGRVIDENSFDFATIINDKFYLSAEKHPVLGRFLGHIKRELDRERKLNLLHTDYGGFLEGKVPGVGELKTIAERLTESDDLHIAGTESINDILCYIIEAKTIYGKFKVWIAPDKGYNALKYTVNKTGRDLFNRKPIEEIKFKEWQLQVDSIKIQKIDDIYVPVEGQHKGRTIYKSGDQVISTIKVKRSEIDLNPDFEALGAFTFNLPDGTVIHDYDFPGVRYKIFGGELVPHVDKAVIEQTDRMDDEILADVTGKTKPELASSAITVSDLLKKYAETQDKLNSSVIVKFECEEKFVQGNEVIIDRVPPSEARLDGQKYFACTNYEYDKVSDTTSPLDETDYRKFTLWDDERRIKYYDYVEVSRASISRQDKPGAIFASEWPGSPLFGIRYHKAERIDTVLRQCETLSVRDEMEIIDSEACYVIDAKSPTSSYTVWMNPNRGYSISQAVIKLGPGTQGAFGVLSENEDRSLTVSDVRFQQIGEVHVPMAYNAYFERRRDGVVYRKGTIRGKVTDITFDPDHEKLASFVPKMRDGTKITDKDFGSRFRWHDGKLVPYVDEAVIEQSNSVSEELMSEGQAPSGTAAKKTKAAPNDQTATKSTQPRTQVDAVKTGPEVVAESGSLPIVLVILISLLIIGLIAWLVFRRIRA